MIFLQKSKNDESTSAIPGQSLAIIASSNVSAIEKVVGQLIEELGAGGFMGIEDLKAGMYFAIIDSQLKEEVEYKGEIIEITENGQIISKSIANDGNEIDINKLHKYEIRIVVDNGVYSWKDIKITNTKDRKYAITIKGNPTVLNRRKYKRMPLSNSCNVSIQGIKKNFNGKMINISANGFAIETTLKEVEEAKNNKITIEIEGLPELGCKKIVGTIIRVTNNSGTYIVGCRMLDDNREIYEYVEKNYKE